MAFHGNEGYAPLHHQDLKHFLRLHIGADGVLTVYPIGVDRVGRIALYGVIGFLIGSIVLVALYRALPPPVTPLMLIRRVEGYGIDKSWRRLDKISPHLIRAAMAGEDPTWPPAVKSHFFVPLGFSAYSLWSLQPK